MTPDFHSPHLLWLLVPLVLLFSGELARRVGAAATFWPKIPRAWAGAFDVALGTKHTTAETRARIWLWFGLAFCIISLARPQWGVIEEQVFDQSREVLIAVDLSRSMLAQDVKPSRLDRSKLLITSLLDGLKGERVGLVLFAGTAFLQSPLSSDYEILREFLPALGPDYLPEGGSNYQAMLETSVQAFGTSTADRYLIILSDGESTEDGWKELAATLKTKGIRVIGLGIGTSQGSFIPDSSGGLVKDERGAVVLSRLDSSTLQSLAQTTGGAYTDASSWIDLAGLLKKTVEAGQKGQFTEKNTARLIERYQWFLVPGLVLLMISFWAEFPVRPRERALPLHRATSRPPRPAQRAAALAIGLLLLTGFGAAQPLPAQTAAPSVSSEDTLAKPLTTTVARLADKDALTAKDYADLAQTTLTYGGRLQSSQKPVTEGVVRDALAGVDLGAKLDAKAADWPRLRTELEALLEKPEQPPEDKKDDQQKQDQPQQQDKNQQQQDQQKQDQQQDDQQKQDEQQKSDSPQKQEQDAFGDMKEPDERQNTEEKSEDTPPPPKPPTQKVGGQPERKEEAPLDPDLAMPLQKLDQVRNQDSPAKLQQLLQGQPQKQPKRGKDW
ncbi:MAG: VWA domain-containing protein [Candidatus Didemnitutus sp.]|nr:VWA domain-containing protein [Candidatus Didemnitutus sp.]